MLGCRCRLANESSVLSPTEWGLRVSRICPLCFRSPLFLRVRSAFFISRRRCAFLRFGFSDMLADQLTPAASHLAMNASTSWPIGRALYPSSWMHLDFTAVTRTLAKFQRRPCGRASTETKTVTAKFARSRRDRRAACVGRAAGRARSLAGSRPPRARSRAGTE